MKHASPNRNYEDLQRFADASFIESRARQIFGGDIEQEHQRAFEAAACAAVWIGIETFGAQNLSARLNKIADILLAEELVGENE